METTNGINQIKNRKTFQLTFRSYRHYMGSKKAISLILEAGRDLASDRSNQ
jgi:hypothetical protein